MYYDKGDPWADGMADISDKVPYMVTVDGARRARYVPVGMVWAGEVWWWLTTRTIARG